MQEQVCLCHLRLHYCIIYILLSTFTQIYIHFIMVKTLEQLKADYDQGLFKLGQAPFSGRDIGRFAQFVPKAQWNDFNIQLKTDCRGGDGSLELTRENIMSELLEDLAFAIRKAKDKRGLSSADMYAVIRMYNYILDEGLEHYDEYDYYGMPLFRATAEKYDWHHLLH